MAIIYGARTDRLINAMDGVTNDADTIIGDGEAETIFGLGGDDLIKGGGGADRLYGGTGIDTAFYSDSGEGVTVNLTTGLAQGGTAEGDQLFDIENVTGSEHGDHLYGNASDNTLRGGGGDDLLKGGGGADNLYGGDGHDRIVIDDNVTDHVDGGDGNDTAYFELGGARSFGFEVDLSRDFYGANVVYPTLTAPPPNLLNIENVSGSRLGDLLRGDDADNMLWGNGGQDFLFGADGNDAIDGGLERDRIIGGRGDDTLSGGADADHFDFLRNDVAEPGVRDFIAPTAMDFGHDVITDFEDGQDKIMVDDTISYATIRAGMEQVGRDVVITFDVDNSITLQNVSLGSLTSSDFLFV